MKREANTDIICFCSDCDHYYRIPIEDVQRFFYDNETIHYKGVHFEGCFLANNYGRIVDRPKLPTRGLTYSQRQWESYLFEEHIKNVSNPIRRFTLRMFRIVVKATQNIRSTLAVFQVKRKKIF